MCGIKRWNGSGRYQSGIVSYVSPVGHICHCTLSVQSSEESSCQNGTYLKSDKNDNPASEPVSMADVGKAVHKPSSPSRDCPEIDSVVSAGRRKWVDGRTCVSHDGRDVQALLCQPSAPDSHLPECSVHPLDIGSRYLLRFKPDGGRQMVGRVRI